MYYETEIKDHIRVPPSYFSENLKEVILRSLNEKYEGFISKDLGIVIAVSEVLHIGEGVIIPGDGAPYYDTRFKILVYKPELQEPLLASVSDITDFGAFLNTGAIDGMVHIGQTMDDFVSFSKTGVITGKESKKVLKVGDKCKARIIAVSYKDINNPKIGLTMRQSQLGTLTWLEEEKKKQEKETKKEKKKK